MSRRRPLVPKVFSVKPSGTTKNATGVVTQHGGGMGMNYSYGMAAYAEREKVKVVDSTCTVCDTTDCTCAYLDSGVYSATTLGAYGIRPNTRIDVEARRFYGALALNMLTKGEHQAGMNTIANDVADQLARAIVLACVGEARYDTQTAMYGLWAARVRKRGARVLNLPLYNNRLINLFELFTNGRPGTREQATEPVARLGNPLDETTVRTLRNIFLWAGRFGRGTSTSYGGLMWAACAQIVLDYVAGRISAVEFVDHAFDARHNGAPVLTKVLPQSTATNMWLSARAEASLEWLARWAPNTVRQQFGYPAVTPLPMSRRVVSYSASAMGNLDTIPEDEGGAYAYKGEHSAYIDTAPENPESLMQVMLDRLRKDEAFLMVATNDPCPHARHDWWHPLRFEHDCEKVCSPDCHCKRWVPRASFQSRDAMVLGIDDEDYEEDDYCVVCDEHGHTSSECDDAIYCDCCAAYKSDVGAETCNHCSQMYCGFCIINQCHPLFTPTTV